jgi:hypothetical protein
MHTLIAMLMILGACIVVVVGLLSVINDLLIRTTRHAPVQFHSHDIDRQGSLGRADEACKLHRE